MGWAVYVVDGGSMRVLPIQVRYILTVALIASVGIVAPSLARGLPAPTPRAVKFDVPGGVASNRVIIKLTGEAQATLHPHGGCVDRKRCVKKQLSNMSPSMSRQWHQWGTLSVKPAYPFEFAHPETAASVGLDRYYIVQVPAGTDTAAMAKELCTCGGEIESAHTDVIGSTSQFFPNDVFFQNDQWNMHNTGQLIQTFYGNDDADIDAPEAWAIHTGNMKTVTIAIIDSGVYAHSEFTGRLLPGFNSNQPFVCSGGPNQDRVCVDDTECPGGAADPNFPCNKINRDTSDNSGHGTHVAGIAAALGNNLAGVAGVSWGANILPIRVLSSIGFGSALHAANGLIWAVDNGADVCNMSLQYYPTEATGPDLTALIAAAEYAKLSDVLVVAAAGNRHCSVISFPCMTTGDCGVSGGTCIFDVAYPGVIADVLTVSATHNADELAEVSNFGPQVDVAAPGESVKSTHNDGSYIFRTGTSMASPHVAGLAALLKSYAPQLSAFQIRSIIESTTDDLGVTGPDTLYGNGRINAWNALLAAPLPFEIQTSSIPEGAVDARIAVSEDGMTPLGWDAIDLTFNGVATYFQPGDFTVSVNPSGPTVTIASVVGVDVVSTITLDSPIPVDAATSFLHNTSGTSRTISHRPGDVDANGIADATDISALKDDLDMPTLASWSSDIDRNNHSSSLDLIRLIDLMP